MRQKAAEILEEEFRTHGILFNEVIFASDEEQTQATPEIVESQNFSSEMAFSSLEDSQDFTLIYGEQVWLEAPTKLMLSLLEELRPKVGKSAQVRNKCKMWKIIEEQMRKEGYSFSAIQIENKFRGMERQYKKTVLNNRQSGRSKQTCPFKASWMQFCRKSGL
ncbi:PREDICTED: trihelix transcription factor GTL1-like [Rhagoletis zephyria]|uniref:trihelix transcription factor GTL1-like n=1 Tax=Rhagoletis zephyria TaxID=28612 RepID=UPI000811841C|nr:PREDICTED: trihelix transcription factor GTL1-like [Rhagoletis zephyria]